jgi:hypothetical protein
MNLVPPTTGAGGNTLRFDADAIAQMECLLAGFGQMYQERTRS